MNTQSNGIARYQALIFIGDPEVSVVAPVRTPGILYKPCTVIVRLRIAEVAGTVIVIPADKAYRVVSAGLIGIIVCAAAVVIPVVVIVRDCHGAVVLNSSLDGIDIGPVIQIRAVYMQGILLERKFVSLK